MLDAELPRAMPPGDADVDIFHAITPLRHCLHYAARAIIFLRHFDYYFIRFAADVFF